ncbi:MAG: DNA repair protein RecO C-terminal domain-containing protein [Planctomycetota bacterium]
MAILKDLAQVLHVYEQGNTSLVVVMLGKRLGQFRVHVKGGRRWPKKGFEGGFDLLTRGEILVYPRHDENLWIFKEWDERARPHTGQSLAMLRAAAFLCELSEALTRPTAGSLRDEFQPPAGIPERPAALYDLLAATADALALGPPPGPLLLVFTLRALQSEGLLPELDACAACGGLLNAWRQVGQASCLPAGGRPAIHRAGGTPAPQRAGWKPALQRAGGTPALQAVWLTGTGLRCQNCVAAAKVRGLFNERGVWLTPEAYRVLLHLSSSGRPVKVSAAAARQLAQALIILVHGALEHDLRTLRGAARLVQEMGR